MENGKIINVYAYGSKDVDNDYENLRIVPGLTHTNVLFDLVKPYECKIDDSYIMEQISLHVAKFHPNHKCVIKIEAPFL